MRPWAAEFFLLQGYCHRPSGLSLTALFLEAEAVSALGLSGVALVSAYLDTVEGAVVVIAAVILTILYCTSDMLVCKFCTHNKLPFVKKNKGHTDIPCAAEVLSAISFGLFTAVRYDP